jgi:hypothetical protein
MRQHQRQFVIGPKPIKVNWDWKTETIQGVGFLSYSPKLPVKKISAQDGSEYILIGVAVQTDPSRPSPLEELKKPPADITDLPHRWTGRFVLIANGVLLTDTAGILGCLYSNREDGLWASSSTALLWTSRTAIFDDRILWSNAGVEWYVAPLSRYAGIRRLLPSQQLDLKTGNVSAKRLFKQVELTYEEALEQIEETLVTAITALAQTSHSLWLPLTAGFDSRLILAAVLRAGVKVQCYTLWHPDMSCADAKMPPMLAALAGFGHVLIRPGKYDRGLEPVFAAHNAEDWADRDKGYICRGQWSQFGETDTILRGAGMELGCPRAVRFHFTRPLKKPSEVPPVETILDGYDQAPTRPLVQALQEWRAWTEQTPHPELDWRDRFYIEQRLGVWASSIEQALDLTASNRVYLSNSGRFMSGVLQMPEHIRQDSAHQVELIRRMAPRLLAHPFNPRDSFIHRAPKSLRRRTRPLWRTIAQKPLGRPVMEFCQRTLGI